MASWELAAERLNGAALFRAADTCPDTCTGLKKLGFWCNGDPCNLGQGNPPFRCECEVQVGAVIGIVIGCVVLACIVGGVIFACWLCMRPRTSVAVGHASTVVVSTPAYTYPDAPQYGQHQQFQQSPVGGQPHAHQQFYNASPPGVNPSYAGGGFGYGQPQPQPMGPVVMATPVVQQQPTYSYTEVPPPQPYQPYHQQQQAYGYGYRDVQQQPPASNSAVDQLGGLPPPPNGRGDNPSTSNPIVKFS